MIIHFIILWFAIVLLIVLTIFLVNAICYMYYHRMKTVWYVQMIALVLSLFVLGGIVLIAFALESFVQL